MAHTNNFREKRERQTNTHNKKAGVMKFRRNLGHRKGRRWRNRLSREWVEERELRQPRSSARNNGHDSWEGTQGSMPDTF